jgi:hypothetical protein
VICLLLYIAGLLLKGGGIGAAFLGLYWIYVLAALIPGIAVSVRRLHDTGRSGWYFLILLIPIIGGVIFIVFMALDSDPGTNEYGPSPKYPDWAGAVAGNAGFPPFGLNAQTPDFTSADNFGFCKNCGTKFQDASPFCNNCGVHR